MLSHRAQRPLTGPSPAESAPGAAGPDEAALTDQTVIHTHRLTCSPQEGQRRSPPWEDSVDPYADPALTAQIWIQDLGWVLGARSPP